MEHSATQVLQDARSLIAKPEHWTQGVFAVDDEGRDIQIDSPKAVAFCAHGAIARVLGAENYGGWACKVTGHPAYKYLLQAMGDGIGFPGRFNNTRTHGEVIEAFDRAIEIAQERRK